MTHDQSIIARKEGEVGKVTMKSTVESIAHINEIPNALPTFDTKQVRKTVTMSLYSLVLLSIVLGAASARFIAIPLVQNYRVVEVDDVRPRYVRQLAYDQGALPSERFERQVPQQQVTLEALEAEESQRFERQAGGDSHEHVDYGAHTGHHGAFGWYADFPVHTN